MRTRYTLATGGATGILVPAAAHDAEAGRVTKVYPVSSTPRESPYVEIIRRGIMKHRILAVLLVLAAVSPFAQAFSGDGPLITATMVLDKVQTGEKEDKTIQITGITSEGYIDGSVEQGPDKGKKRFIFAELKKLVFDLGRHAYDVTDRQGKTWTLKFAQIKTHNTSPTFDCMIKNPETGKIEKMMGDYTQIKSLEFGEPPAAGTAETAKEVPGAASEPAKP